MSRSPPPSISTSSRSPPPPSPTLPSAYINNNPLSPTSSLDESLSSLSRRNSRWGMQGGPLGAYVKDGNSGEARKSRYMGSSGNLKGLAIVEGNAGVGRLRKISSNGSVTGMAPSGIYRQNRPSFSNSTTTYLTNTSNPVRYHHSPASSLDSTVSFTNSPPSSAENLLSSSSSREGSGSSSGSGSTTNLHFVASASRETTVSTDADRQTVKHIPSRSHLPTPRSTGSGVDSLDALLSSEPSSGSPRRSSERERDLDEVNPHDSRFWGNFNRDSVVQNSRLSEDDEDQGFRALDFNNFLRSLNGTNSTAMSSQSTIQNSSFDSRQSRSPSPTLPSVAPLSLTRDQTSPHKRNNSLGIVRKASKSFQDAVSEQRQKNKTLIQKEGEVTIKQVPLQPPSTRRPSHVKQSSSLSLSVSSSLSSSPTPTPQNMPSRREDAFLSYLQSQEAQGFPVPETVDLSSRKASFLSEATIDFLKNGAAKREKDGKVQRLALGYNSLSNLPSSFLKLGDALRYLNIRTCALRKVPKVITQLPKLEILDLRANKITKLPKRPGTLLKIKVLSLSKNRLIALPYWFVDCNQLRVLKIEGNPLNWPPKDVLSAPSSMSNPDDLEELSKNKQWIDGIKEWLRNNKEKVEEAVVSSDLEEDSPSKIIPSPRSIGHPPQSSSSPQDQNYNEERFFEGKLSNASAAFTESPFSSPALVKTPLGSNDRARKTSVRSIASPLIHGRNASVSSSSSPAPQQVKNLKGKKSLPDLRMNHSEIIEERRKAMAGEIPFPRELVLASLNEEDDGESTTPKTADIVVPPLPLVSTGRLGRSQSDRPSIQMLVNGQSNINRSVKNSEPKLRRMEQDGITRGKDSETSMDRDSQAYFRRLSMLPASTISKTVPPSLLQFTDAIRGILFSLSQMYSSLKQFVAFATDTLPAGLSRVMGSADGSMSRLIKALDRFDNGSRRGTPPVNVIRDVLTTCRENVTVFGTLTGVLSIQLKVLISTADVRYSRTLLLMLHGTMAEVAIAWQTMVPLSKDVMLLLGTQDTNAMAKVTLQPPTPSPTIHESPFSTPPPVPAIPSRHVKTNSGSTVFQPSPLGQSAVMSNGSLQTRETKAQSASRRHGGSFSVEDVQIGASMPSESSPPLNDTVISVAPVQNTNTPFRMKSRPAVPNVSPLPSDKATFQDMMIALENQPPTPTITPSHSPFMSSQGRGHEKSTSRDSIDTSQHTPLVSQGSSSSLTAYSRPGTAPASIRSHSQTTRFHATPQLDSDFLDQADNATSIAFSTISMLVECLSEDQLQLHEKFTANVGKAQSSDFAMDKVRELLGLCEHGNEIGAQFKKVISRIRQGELDIEGGFKKSDISSAFYKFSTNVKRIAELCKMISLELDQSILPPRVRQGLKSLIENTKETAVLLAVSTFNPEKSSTTPSRLLAMPPRPGTSNGVLATSSLPQNFGPIYDVHSHSQSDVSTPSAPYNFV